MSCFFSICCGEGEEEAKFGTLVDPSDYDWEDSASAHIRESKQRIRSLEHQIQIVNKNRPLIRGTVCSKPVDVNSNFEPPVFPKTNEQVQFLEHALRDNFIFMDLADDERRLFINAMQHEQVTQDTIIIQQGDVGDFFYVVENGQVDFVKDGDKTVGSCGRGGAFGELALLYDSPRAVSCIAKSSTVSLWKVDQHTFRHILAHHAHCHCGHMKEMLRKIEIFKNLDDVLVARFVEAMTPVHWKKGDRIVQKGEEGNVFYIILDGRVKIHDIGLGDSQYEDQELGKGDSFGERALLTGEPRAANVTALSEVITMAMGRETFEESIGPLEDILRRDMRKKFIRSLPLFSKSDLSLPEIDQLADLMTQVCYPEGDALAELGMPCQMKLWIIRHGRLLVYGEDPDKIFNLQSGDYFGDETIRKEPDSPSPVTAICEENLTTWVLTREDIESVIGDIERLGEAVGFVKGKQDKSILLSDLTKVHILGVGAFGTVWLVRQKETSSIFALKSISKRKLIDSQQAHSVTREKELLCLLEHPFILHLVSSFQDEKNLYLLLPVIAGGELFSQLQRRRTKKRGMPNRDAAFYGACIIEALGHFHQRHVAYRDLKLENVLIDEDGYAVIVDLGFAKIVTDKTYTLLGTPEYLAPEILMAKGHNKAVDYWSYGVLIYELLVGQSPFYKQGSSRMDMFKRIVVVEYRIPEYINDPARSLIEKLLVRRQSSRLGNMASGYLDVKNHEWFKNADILFKELLKKKANAPWKPTVKDPLSNYDDYTLQENDMDMGKRLTKEEQDVFRDF